jgi:hypothetical protein
LGTSIRNKDIEFQGDAAATEALDVLRASEPTPVEASIHSVA